MTKSKSGLKTIPPIRSLDFGQDRIFRTHVLPDLDYYHRSHFIGEPAIENVVALVPHSQNVRLSAQQGLFICPSQVGPTLLEQMEKVMFDEDIKSEWLIKIVFPRTFRKELLRHLFQMNIHPLSLFPGADGLGKFCALKAELFGWE